MFFLFGSPRSGTTLLAQCLNAHPALVVPHETDFIVPLAFLRDRVVDAGVGRELATRLVVATDGFAASLGEHLAPADVADAIAGAAYDLPAMVEAIYRRIADARGCALAGDKSPNDLNFIRILDKTGLLAAPRRVVHLVRDGRDVLASLQRANWQNSNVRLFPHLWAAGNAYLAEAMAAAPDRYLCLRYEDFVADPDAWLHRICAHLGVAHDPAMLDPERRHARYRDQVQHHARLYQPISAASVGCHRRELDAATRARFERIAGHALAQFGYC